MEKIFSYNVDIDKTAYMNWRTRQHKPIHDMMIIADGYMKAAIMLAQDCLQDNGDKKADIVVFPMLFSANHAIELYLKSINGSLNMLLNMKESFCGGHDIRQIWNTVKKRMIGFETDKEQRKQFKKMTKELDDYISELYDNRSSESYKTRIYKKIITLKEGEKMNIFYSNLYLNIEKEGQKIKLKILEQNIEIDKKNEISKKGRKQLEEWFSMSYVFTYDLSRQGYNEMIQKLDEHSNNRKDALNKCYNQIRTNYFKKHKNCYCS